MVKNINFFTVATGKYRDFIVPYITSVLYQNPNAIVEILVDDLNAVSQDIIILNKLFYGGYRIMPIDPIDIIKIKNCGMRWSSTAATLRFLTVPSLRLEYTYIGDIDILIMQKDIRSLHIQHMQSLGVPYSNMVRKNQKRLTGLHCVKTDDYYKKLNKKALVAYKNAFLTPTSTCLDEHLLYKMVQDTFGIPDVLVQNTINANKLYRPYHGVHCTLNATKWYGSMYIKEFLQFMECDYIKTNFLPNYKPWYVAKLRSLYSRYKNGNNS